MNLIISIVTLSIILIMLIILIIILHRYSKILKVGKCYYSHKLNLTLQIQSKDDKLGLCFGVYASVNHRIYNDDELRYYSIFFIIENKFNEIGNGY